MMIIASVSRAGYPDSNKTPKWQYNLIKEGSLHMNLIGEIAALVTSLCFAITAMIFTSAGRMIGSQATNRLRLLFALAYLVILNSILFREPLPFSAESSRWIWLSLSGIIGLSLGDMFFFLSLVSVGP